MAFVDDVTQEWRQACRNALADYLRATLGPLYPAAANNDPTKADPGLQVWNYWPTPGVPLPLYAISITIPSGISRAGGMVHGVGMEVQVTQPIPWKVTPDADPSSINGTILYSFGHLSLGYQLDCWSNFEPARNQLQRNVVRAVNRPVDVTLNGADPADDYPMKPGLSIRIPELYNVASSWSFSQIPITDVNASKAQVGEFRASFEGTCQVFLVDQFNGPLAKQVAILGSLNGGAQSTVQVTP